MLTNQEIQQNQSQSNKFKVIRRQLQNFYPNNGYFFTNTLDIKTEPFSLNYINSTNQNRLNVIMKLHKKNQSIKEVASFLNYMVFKEEIRKIIIQLKMFGFVLKIKEKRTKKTLYLIQSR